jgi:hypothetical protein
MQSSFLASSRAIECTTLPPLIIWTDRASTAALCSIFSLAFAFRSSAVLKRSSLPPITFARSWLGTGSSALSGPTTSVKSSGLLVCGAAMSLGRGGGKPIPGLPAVFAVLGRGLGRTAVAEMGLAVGACGAGAAEWAEAALGRSEEGGLEKAAAV